MTTVQIKRTLPSRSTSVTSDTLSNIPSMLTLWKKARSGKALFAEVISQFSLVGDEIGILSTS